MRHLYILLFLFLLIFQFSSCNQVEDEIPATVSLEASKLSDIRKGEPVLFHFNTTLEESDIQWNVIPNTGVNLFPNGNKASVMFDLAGNYNVNATFGSSVVGADVQVIDSVYIPVQHEIVPFKPDEEIYVSVTVFDSTSVGGSPDLLIFMTFTTSNRYDCLNNSLRINQQYVSVLSQYNISFEGVYIPDFRYCADGEQTAQQTVVLHPDLSGMMRSYRIEITLLGNTYIGSFFVEGGQFFIEWPYTEGILFTDAVIIGKDNGEDCSIDMDNPDVDLFVSLLKAGTYNCYVKNEYGENLWLAMPKFNGGHIEALLEYAEDTAKISRFPVNPVSSRPPLPVGRDYFILNECLLWIVEGLRTGLGTFNFPLLDPYLVDNSKPAGERERGLSVSEIMDVGELYYSWWHNSAIMEWWLRNPPLEGTSYSWF